MLKHPTKHLEQQRVCMCRKQYVVCQCTNMDKSLITKKKHNCTNSVRKRFDTIDLISAVSTLILLLCNLKIAFIVKQVKYTTHRDIIPQQRYNSFNVQLKAPQKRRLLINHRNGIYGWLPANKKFPSYLCDTQKQTRCGNISLRKMPKEVLK